MAFLWLNWCTKNADDINLFRQKNPPDDDDNKQEPTSEPQERTKEGIATQEKINNYPNLSGGWLKGGHLKFGGGTEMEATRCTLTTVFVVFGKVVNGVRLQFKVFRTGSSFTTLRKLESQLIEASIGPYSFHP